MMAERMVPLCKSAHTSSTLRIWPQTEHHLTGVEEECQAWAFYAQSLSKGLTHPPSLGSRPPPLLRDAPTLVLRLVLVVALLS